MKNLVDRFIKYIKIDSQSNPESETTPSTEKQWNMANLLVEELKAIGLQDVTVDENAYVMATLPSNVDYPVPTIGFISHFDTSPDFSGENVNPQFVENYDKISYYHLLILRICCSTKAIPLSQLMELPFWELTIRQVLPKS